MFTAAFLLCFSSLQLCVVTETMETKTYTKESACLQEARQQALEIYNKIAETSAAVVVGYRCVKQKETI